MLGLHALGLSPESVLFIEIILVCSALFALFGGEPENRTQKAVVWSFGIIAALAIGRIILGPIPNVQPVTIGLLLVGATYGLSLIHI